MYSGIINDFNKCVNNKPFLIFCNIKTLDNLLIIIIIIMVESSLPKFNGFKSIERLGKGAYGITFLVQHMETEEKFAIKMVDDYSDNKQAKEEVEFLQRTDHPYIIKYFGHFPYPGSHRDEHCIVLEYADGCDLRSKMATMDNKISEDLALTWFAQASLALLQMHSKGIIHRDIKPENILIVGKIAKLADFGTVKEIEQATHMTMQAGTLEYFAPERLTESYSFKSDVWSLGIVLFEMISGGNHPFFAKGTKFHQYMKDLPAQDIKQMPKNISKPCEQLIKKLLEKNKKKRPTMAKIVEEPIIWGKIQQIVQDHLNGPEIGNAIKQQLIDLKISGLVEAPKEEEKKQSGFIAAISSIFAKKPQPKPQPLPQSQPQPSNHFTQQMLDRLIDTVNKPFNKYSPRLNANGQSKMAECILSIHGWMWSLQELNQLAKNEAQWAVFEGKKSEGSVVFEQGVYYGEMLDGNRHGYGIVYTADTGGAFLFECQWDKGIPVEGRHIVIWSIINTWVRKRHRHKGRIP
ncbi:hypothetical protein FGO68_gene16926 [Halteria grandinella]|uniref:non-specific serine/threonine protein kinase n=1 Tax=Halteria grandinella TaxID=5974 RepID=A0A8J8NVN3_HALGN|nr:hypothetical protein FGO68_gene16926 [Halteria grandinella]